MGPRGEDEPRGGVGYADLHALSDADREVASKTIGIPQQVSSAGLVDALPITSKWLDNLERAASFGELDEWAASIADDPEFTSLIYQTLMAADMGGQLFVRTVEVPESLPRKTSLARVEPDAFFSLPFEEAIAAFLARVVISPEEYRRLSAEARARAFSVSRLTSTELVKRVREVIGRTLEDGGSYRDFVRQVRAGEVDLGITATNPAYLETIFRTNTQSAYGAGRLRQLTDPIVVAARPYLEFRTARDGRVSGAGDPVGSEAWNKGHAQLEGVIFEQSDPGWRAYSPPLRWNCRCGIVARRAEDVDRSRVALSSQLSRDMLVPGFGW